jgi:hypothetical protein
VIGKSLNERHTLGPLPAERAITILKASLASQAPHLVEIRAQDPRMIACLFVRADKASIRLCRSLGFRLKLGGTGAFGLLGADAARLFAELLRQPDSPQQAWLEEPCGPRETKVLLVAGGTALLSLETNDGKLTVTTAP